MYIYYCYELITTLIFECKTPFSHIICSFHAPHIRYPSIRFISALGDPKASSGTGAEAWGLWVDDPGPRGVWLREYERRLADNDNKAPAGWTFDPKDW